MEDIRKGVCPLCRHNEILKAPPQGPGAPLFVAAGYEDDDPARPDHKWPEPRAVPRGVLWLYVCRNCGFAQFFASSPEKIPIGSVGIGVAATLIKGPEPSGPYR